MLLDVFRSSVKVLALSTAVGLAAMVLDDKWTLGRMMFAAVLSCAVLCAFRVGRAIWVTDQVVLLIVARSRLNEDSDDDEQSPGATP